MATSPWCGASSISCQRRRPERHRRNRGRPNDLARSQRRHLRGQRRLPRIRDRKPRGSPELGVQQPEPRMNAFSAYTPGGVGISNRREVTMSVSAESLDALSAKIDEAKRAITAAASESEVELKAKVDEARKNADEFADEWNAKAQAIDDKGEAHWQQIQSDWERHRQSVRRRIDEAKTAQDIDAAEIRAEWAEGDARDAVAYASNAIDEAKYAMLDAILARKDVSILVKR